MTVQAFGVAPLSRDRSTMVPQVRFKVVSLSLLSVIRERELITHYTGLTVRGTGPDITAIRLSGLAIL